MYVIHHYNLAYLSRFDIHVGDTIMLKNCGAENYFFNEKKEGTIKGFYLGEGGRTFTELRVMDYLTKNLIIFPLNKEYKYDNEHIISAIPIKLILAEKLVTRINDCLNL